MLDETSDRVWMEKRSRLGTDALLRAVLGTAGDQADGWPVRVALEEALLGRAACDETTEEAVHLVDASCCREAGAELCAAVLREADLARRVITGGAARIAA